MAGWLAQACGWSETIEPSLPRDWIGRFALSALPKDSWVVNPEALARLRT